MLFRSDEFTPNDTLKIPETYIIDRKGIVRRKFVSAVDWSQPEILDFLNKL